MACKSRLELKALFAANRKLTESALLDLIDSNLNKRDDCFFGKWEAGTEYCNGSVVFYEKCFYVLDLPVEQECIPVDSEAVPTNPTPKKGIPNTRERDKPGCLCSTIPPSMDTKNWCKIGCDCEALQADIRSNTEWIESQNTYIANLESKINALELRIEALEGEHGTQP